MDGLHRGFPHWKSWVVLLNNLAVAQAAETFLWRLQVGLCGPRGTLSLGLLPPWVCLGTVVPLAALLETHCAVLCSPSTNPRSGWRRKLPGEFSLEGEGRLGFKSGPRQALFT